MKERIGILQRCELFKTMPAEALEMIAARAEEGSAAEGEAILLEGKPADGIYVIVEGTVDYIKKVDEKRGLVLFRWQAGDVLGLNSVLDGKEQYVSALATAPAKLLKIPVIDLWAVCGEDPLYEHRFFHQTLCLQSAALRQITVRLREFLAKIIK